MDSARAVVRVVGDRRETASVGRQARLELVFGCRAGRTILSHAYAEPPFRAGRCFADGDGARMIMASSAPGIFGGDYLTQRIIVEQGARVHLVSQSALQVHAVPDGQPARLCSTYIVEDDAELRCEWDPLIPFARARLDQQIAVRLAARSRLFWSDAFMNGREARGERWAFGELSQNLQICRAETLEYIERYRLIPEHDPPDRAWVAGAACYFGTIVASGRPIDPAPVTDLHAALAGVDQVRGAVDRLGDRLVLVRLMAESGAAFRDARAMARCL